MPLFSSQRNDLTLWKAARKKRLTPPFHGPFHFISSSLLPLHFAFFYFIASPFPHLCSVKQPGIQMPKRWLFWNISSPSSWSAGFLNKDMPLFHHLVSRIFGLLCGKQSELELGNSFTSFHVYSIDILIVVNMGIAYDILKVKTI